MVADWHFKDKCEIIQIWHFEGAWL